MGDLPELLLNVSTLFPKLEYLSLLNNPVCPSVYFEHSNERLYKRYRQRVLARLPELKLIDTTPVTREERESASRLQAIARPKAGSDDLDPGDSGEPEARGMSFAGEPVAEPAAF